MPGTLSTTKTYDTLGRLASVVNAAGNVALSAFTYTVDNGDRRTRVDLVDGGHWDYTYDNAGQLTGGVRYGPRLPDNAQTTMVQYAYVYDAMGNPLTRTEDAGVSAYTFNNLNQLLTGGWSGTLSAFGSTRTQNLASVAVATGQQTETATVFEKGEWTAKGLAVPAGDTTLTVTRTAQDQTSSVSSVSINRPQGGVQFVHDLNGNLLGDGTWTYTWDCDNRLVAAERAATTRLTFVYDALSRRRVLREYTWATDTWQLTTERFFLWDSWLLVEERIVDHTVTPAAESARTYLCGLDLSSQLGGEGQDPMATAGGIGGILSVAVSSALDTRPSSLFLYDGNGNVANLADPATGSAAATYEYGPFGNVLVASGPLADRNPIRFSTKYHDPATGLVYYGCRYYHPGQGRWVSRDPIGESGGANLDAFVANSVPQGVDSLGWFALPIIAPPPPSATPLPPPAAYPYSLDVRALTPSVGYCGSVSLAASFTVDPPAARASTVIQEMTFTFAVARADGTLVSMIDGVPSPTTHYWEAFDVPKGRSESYGDAWGWREMPCTRGRVKVAGSAVFFHGRGTPSAMGYSVGGVFYKGPHTHPWSGGTPSSTVKPLLGWWLAPDTPSSGKVVRHLTIEWDCTRARMKTRITGNTVSYAGGI